MTFTTQSMQEILPLLQDALHQRQVVSFFVLNPDNYNLYAGEKVEITQQIYLYRSYKSWNELAELLGCKMLTPKKADYPLVELTFKKLSADSFHQASKDSEKYGTTSHFARIHKMEEPAFFYYYNQALENVKIEQRRRILNLGINRGDEFAIIKKKLDTKKYENIHFVGIDHSKTAIAYAKTIFPENNVTLYAEDINHIDNLRLGKFDLLISIGTLQSPSINLKPFVMKLVQEYLKKDAALILGFPNSRWVGGEMLYGAKAPNYAMSEQSLLYNDVIFCKRYLQQKRYRVTLTGKHYLFLTATKIG